LKGERLEQKVQLIPDAKHIISSRLDRTSNACLAFYTKTECFTSRNLLSSFYKKKNLACSLITQNIKQEEFIVWLQIHRNQAKKKFPLQTIWWLRSAEPVSLCNTHACTHCDTVTQTHTHTHT